MYYDELYHHGILGQKWGIRRFQNKDGSLTAEGIKRYRTDLKFKAKYDKYTAKQEEKKKKAEHEKETKRLNELKSKKVGDLTDEELAERYNRLVMEQKVKDLEGPSGNNNGGNKNQNQNNAQQSANLGKKMAMDFVYKTAGTITSLAANKVANGVMNKLFGKDASKETKQQIQQAAQAMANATQQAVQEATKSASDKPAKDKGKDAKYSYDLIDAYMSKPASWEGSPSSIFGIKKGTNDGYSNFLNDTKSYGDSQKMAATTLANAQRSWESSPSSIFGTKKGTNDSYSYFLNDSKSYGDSLKMAKTTLANDAYTKYESFASNKSNRESIDAGKNWLSGVMDNSSRSIINKTAGYNDKSNAISKSTVTYDAPQSKTTNTKYSVTDKKLLRHSDDVEVDGDEEGDLIMDGGWIIKKKR